MHQNNSLFCFLKAMTHIPGHGFFQQQKLWYKKLLSLEEKVTRRDSVQSKQNWGAQQLQVMDHEILSVLEQNISIEGQI